MTVWKPLSQNYQALSCAALFAVFRTCVSRSHPFRQIWNWLWLALFCKMDDNLCKENYRSIYILTIMSKLLGNILSDQITNYFRNQIFSQLSAYLND